MSLGNVGGGLGAAVGATGTVGGGVGGSIEGISYESVTQSANEIKNAADNVLSLLKQTEEKMKAVNTDSLWRSQSAEAAYHKFQSLAKYFEKLYEELTSYHKFLLKTVETYKEADRVISAKADELLNSENV